MRYVDNIFAMVDTDFNVENFLDNLNYQYSTVEFTFKEEIDG